MDLDVAFERIARALPGYEVRPAQRDMAGAVLRALQFDERLCVEAGTGTGKSLAYGVAALLSGRTVVISTHTRALQDQLEKKDLPILERALELPPSVAVLKGIANYVCRRKLAELEDRHGPDHPDVSRFTAWLAQSQTGDRAELATPEGDPAWLGVRATAETRIGSRCTHFERCYVTLARRRAAEARLVVVNHHLFFADLALRAVWPEAQLLPPYDAVIFDEAHAIEDVATEHFGIQVSSARVDALARDLRKAEEDQDADHLAVVATELFASLRERLGGTSRVTAPEDLFERGAAEPLQAFEAFLDALGRRLGDDGEEPRRLLGRRASALLEDLRALAGRRLHGYAYWLERRLRSVVVGASPVDVSGLVRERLLSAAPALVFTSATLATGDEARRFAYFRGRLGLDDAAVAERVLPSPFDYGEQALLYLPGGLPDPSDPAWPDAVAAEARRLVALSRGGAFLLFTTHRNLQAVAARLRPECRFPLLVQGDLPAPALLDAFRARSDAVLLGTASFWEGVDVAGEALRLVVIDKLPFAPPDDPLAAARIALLRERGRDPFRELQLPRAALQLKQGFGRLIRRRDDRGVVALLDPRLTAKGYGRGLLAALPPATRTSSLDEVRAFYGGPG